MRRLSDVSGFHVFLMFLIPQRARGWCGDELCLATPEVYEGVRDDVLPGSWQSLGAELASKRGAETVHDCTSHPWFATRA